MAPVTLAALEVVVDAFGFDALDELLPQATSADYSEGGSGAAEDSENVDPPPSGGGGGVLRDRFAA
jgi:hypothetical protein